MGLQEENIAGMHMINVNAEVKEEARRIIREILTLTGAREVQFVELCLLESRLAHMARLNMERAYDGPNPDYEALKNEIRCRNVLRGQ